ncbi:MAG TPA: hypothetical protein VHX65_20645 [Pirellulales bacterium]|jgi:hypothetical protein|nr:hypothetical protein [Pirellulales bacterium]
MRNDTSIRIRAALLSGAALVAALVSGGPAHAIPSLVNGRIDSDSFWTWNCIIYAEVSHEWTKSGDSGSGTIVLHVLGTLSGGYDAGAVPILKVNCARRVAAKPRDKVLVALFSTDILAAKPSKNHEYVVQFDWREAEPAIEPFRIVNRLSDAPVRGTLASVQELRQKPRPIAGRSPKFWRQHSVVYAEASEVVPSSTSDRQRYAFEILGTLSGEYDAAKTHELFFDANFRSLFFILDDRVSKISRGDKMLLLLARTGPRKDWRIADERAEFMPFTRDPIIRLATGGQHSPHAFNAMFKIVNDTLAQIQTRRVDAVPGSSVSPH